MKLSNAKKIVLIIFLFLIIIISVLTWSSKEMTTSHKIGYIIYIILYFTFPITYFLSADSIEKIQSRAAIGGLALIAFAFMTLIPIYVLDSLANILDKYEFIIVLFLPFWGLNVYCGIKIFKYAYRKFKKTEARQNIEKRNNRNVIKTNFLTKIKDALRFSLPISAGTILGVFAYSTEKFSDTLFTAGIASAVVFLFVTLLYMIWRYKKEKIK